MAAPVPRDPEIAAAAIKPNVNRLFAGSDGIRTAASKMVARLGIHEAVPSLIQLVGDKSQSAECRIEALHAIEQLDIERVNDVLDAALNDHQPEIRSEARRLLAKLRPDDAKPVLKAVLEHGELVERQQVLVTLGDMPPATAADLLESTMTRLLEGKLPLELHLDVLEAARKQNTPKLNELLAQFEAARPKDDLLAEYRETLVGGDAARGKAIFHDKPETSCLRCHRIGNEGGEVGPDLTQIASILAKQLKEESAAAAQSKLRDASLLSKQPSHGDLLVREYLLEAIVTPNKRIAKGFETVVIVTNDGFSITGILQNEDDKNVRLVTAEGKRVTIPKQSIESSTAGPSAMPDNLIKHLSKQELRDLIEYLAGLRKSGRPRKVVPI